jgi:hypothetical protein
MTAAGYVQESTGAAGEIPLGRFYETVDNTGGGAAGAQLADVDYLRERNVILLNNDTGTACVIADRERPCYLLDGQTATMNTAKTPGIVCYDVTSEGVWVEILSIT